MVKIRVFSCLLVCTLFLGCNVLNRSQSTASIGAGEGAAEGAEIENASGNTSLTAITEATVGGAAGAVIGEKMDEQAGEIEQELDGAKIERVGQGIVVEFNNDALFDPDSITLKDFAKTNLTRFADVLKEYPHTNIHIQGHTDNEGESRSNQDLSEEQAIAAANYLAENGIVASRLTIIGFGDEEPKYTNDTEEGQAQNRRVEFVITANKEMIAEAEREAGGNES